MNSLNLTYQSALAQHQAGDVAQAEGLYNEVLANDPGHMDAIFNLAVLLASQNRTNEAIPLYELVLEVLPDDPDTLSNMGNAYTNTGQLEQAMDCYQRAIEGNPLLSAAHINLGNLFFQQGHTDQAIERYHEAISIDPSAANAHNNLGTILLAAGRRDEAKASYQAALKYDADNPETLKNYGNILLSFGEIEDAADIMRQVVAIAPNWAPAQADLGLTLMRLDDFVPAREALERAVALEPTFIEAWNCLGNLLHLMELHDDCEQTLRQALQVEPNNPVTAFHLGTLYFGQTRFEEALTQFARACEFQPDSADYRNSYVSPDFRFHSVSVAFKGILDNHDTDRIEAYGYAAHSAEDDHMTNALRERFHGYRQMNGQPFEVSAQQIYDDGIDILVDLAGHTKGGQLSLLALKPAPIQAHYLGYSATIGASYLDYLITDHHQVPEEQRQYFSENLVYLPDTFMATQRAPVAIDAFTRAQCGLPEDAFVFANFNTHYKIEPRMFAIWMRLLRKIPKAVLWLVRGTNSSADNLRREASARGVAPERLIFADKVLHPVHLARLANADLALDNYYHGGGVTTVDCLWMGLPVLTLAGPTPQSRNGATLLSAIGREDMIQHRIEDYEAMAFDLA